MILPVALLLLALDQPTVEQQKKFYTHPPAAFKFLCTVDACPIDMGKSWVTIDEYDGKFMECHDPSDSRFSSNCYDIPHQKPPAGCKARRGHTWYQDCVAAKEARQ